MDFDNDAFSEGVEIGGLTDRTEIKVLICYLLKSLDRPLSKKQLNEIMQQEALANYFEVSQAVGDLISQGNISYELTKENEEILTITQQGIEIAESLEVDLPRSVREKAINAAIKLLTLARRKQENKIVINQIDDGYNVTFTLGDEKTELMKLTVYVADKMQVEIIKKNFLDDPIKLYSGIISSLTV